MDYELENDSDTPSEINDVANTAISNKSKRLYENESNPISKFFYFYYFRNTKNIYFL